MTATAAKVHHEMTTYPMSTPAVKVAPAKAGPAALPMADILVATPFKVPKTLKVAALFVNRMVEQGKAKMPQKPLTSINAIMTTCLDWFVDKRAVKGVAT